MEAIDDILLEEQRQPMLYSKRAILASTFLTGPLTAGVLLRRNLIELGQAQKAQNVLFAAIGFTIFVGFVLVLTPEDVINRIPSVVFPLAYTGITAMVIQSLMGKELDQNKAEGGPNFPTSRLIGVAILYALVNVASIVVLFLILDSFNNTGL